ncbi:MAG: methionine--tRNA ligase [Methanomethylophilus sp.]
MSKVCINIAWPYANGPIHLGHVAGSLLPPDIFSRYNRLLGNEVLMVGGSDQHGTPITVTAEKEGVQPVDIAERYHNINKKAIEDLGIQYSLFNKTHCPTHYEVTQQIFKKLLAKGYICTKDEDEYYCPKCKRFLPDRYVEGTCPNCHATDVRSDQCDNCGTTFVPGDVIDPHCTHCGTRPEVRASKQFFLRLSVFEKPLLDYLATKDFWRPNVKAYTENFLKGGLKDRAITRDMSWGVPIPVEGWDDKVIYVWFEAVIGYLSASEEYSRMIGKPDYWKEFWEDPECRHYYFIGKDNIPFHSIIWPAILMGVGGLNLPYDIPANEYLMFNGGKLSKSRKGTVSDVESLIPKDIPHVLQKFDPEAIRYYLSVIMPDTHDAEFSWDDFQTKVNSELVAALGNFYHRGLSFTYKNFGEVPAAGEPDPKVTAALTAAREEITGLLSHCDFKKAIQAVMHLAHFGNEYFDSVKPWALLRTDKTACGRVLYENLRIVKALCILAWPFLPRSSEKIWGYLGCTEPLEKTGYAGMLTPLPAGQKLSEPIPVYAKVDLKVLYPELFAQEKKAVPAQKPVPNAACEPFDAFRKLDLRVGQIVEAGDHPDADKLFLLKVDLGEKEPRQICAGLKAYYTADEIRGRKVIAVANLEPRPLRGIFSNGMLLAADDEDQGGRTVALLKPSKDVPVGTRFDCGFGGERSTINYKKDFTAVTMKVSAVVEGRFVSEDKTIELPAGAPTTVAAVLDGGKVIALGDGKGCVATVDRELKNGAGVR